MNAVKMELISQADIPADWPFKEIRTETNSNGQVQYFIYQVGSRRNQEIRATITHAIAIATLNDRTDTVRLLLDHGGAPSQTACRDAIANGNVEIVSQFLDKGYDIHTSDDEALTKAAELGNLEMVNMLINKGADVHANDDEALRKAIEGSHTTFVVPTSDDLGVVSSLLRAGANIHAGNDKIILLARHKPAMINLLLEAGANIDFPIPRDWDSANVHLLIERGAILQAAEIQLADYRDYTPPMRYIGPLCASEALHGFFDAFCKHALSASPAQMLRFKQVMVHSSDILKFTQEDLKIIREGTELDLCKWMTQKQRQRCEPCQVDGHLGVEIFTQEDVGNIPLLFLYVTSDNHCFNIVYLAQFLFENQLQVRTPVNPLTRLPFSIDEQEKILAKYRAIEKVMKIVFEMIPETERS